MSVIKSAIDNRQIVLTLTFLIFVFGLVALLTMPRREDPKFNVRQGLVVFAYPGATAEEINKKVVNKVENLLFSFEEVRKDKTYSNSREGVAYIVVELESFVTETDIFWSKLQHQLNQVKLTSLPAGVIGPIVESGFGDTIALLVSFDSKERSERELNSYTDQLANRLRQLRSLAKIDRINSEQEAIYIYLDNQKLTQYKLFLPQIIRTFNEGNATLPSGSLTANGQVFSILKPKQFEDIASIENQAIGVGPAGKTIRLKDIATIERGLQKKSQIIRVNGESSVLLSLQMQNGYNIVDFGKSVDEIITEFSKAIPQDVSITKVVDQPQNVAESINDFIREFFIAIVSVIIIIMLMLPLRVAFIAATAIPVTVAFTFAIMNGVNIQLQQVSLASLIVVLGLLVDDAVIIADNYVEKLDEGMDRYQAAWKSASELTIPMFTAGLTIVGAFFPLLFLSGYVGEFISSLPITVAIAINASFVIAMFLTPFMCYKFITEGLKKPENQKKRKSFLDLLQSFFNQSINWAFKHQAITLIFSVLLILGGGGLFLILDQKLFPAAERSQFVIELRAEEGTSLDEMDAQTRKLESLIRDDERLVSYTSFTGTSAPRFYYNFSPHFPQSNFAQLLINTSSIEATDEWVEELENTLGDQIPFCQVNVKKMQQGTSMEAPIEIRISGSRSYTLDDTANEVLQIFNKKLPGTLLANDNYELKTDLGLKIDNNALQQLSINSGDIALQLAVAFEGISIGDIWEAKSAIPIILKDERADEKSLASLDQFYVTAPLTGASFPLKQVADVSPTAVRTNVRNRNGMLTTTILAYPKSSELPSKLLTEVKKDILSLDIPEDQQISIGGEDENQRETFAEMNKVMVISLFIIFIIILIQFKRLNHVFIVLSAIPLCLFGASFGLLISGYPFGFTAFVGLASLIGISVRNSIILVDYANELVTKENMSIAEAAVRSAERRIRPIFLTTMAAAIGVTPMIISGSPMWAPLATVLAVGLLFAMFMTLITIPILYAKFGAFTPKINVKTSLILLLFLAPNLINAQTIDLQSCYNNAIKNNQDLELIKNEIKKKELESERVSTNYLPRVNIDGGYFWYYNSARVTDVNIEINSLPIIGDTPPIGIGTELKIPEGNRFMGVANVGIYQPITQIFKINSGLNVKKSEVAILQEQYEMGQNEIRDGVTKLYVAISIEDTLIHNLEKQIRLIEKQEKTIEDAVNSGEVLDVYTIGLKADLLDHKTKMQEAMSKKKTYYMQLNRIMAFPADSVWYTEELSINEYRINTLLNQVKYDSVYANNSSYKLSNLKSQMALDGISYYKNSKLPEVTFAAEGFYFEQFPLVPQNNVLVGLAVNWPILQWGKQNKDLAIAKVTYEQAKLQSELVKKDIEINIQTKVTELENSLLLLETASQALEFRKEEKRIQENAYINGLLSYNDYADVQKKYLDSVTQLIKAKANVIVKESELRSITNMYE